MTTNHPSCPRCLKDPKGDCGFHTNIVEDPLEYLRGVIPHKCSGSCPHKSGLPKDEGSPRVTSPVEGGTPQGSPEVAPTPDPEDPCEDCQCALKDHSGSKGNCVYCACKGFVPVGPKS